LVRKTPSPSPVHVTGEGTVWCRAKQTPIDLPKLRALIEKTGYRGFLRIEALGQGDPATIVTVKKSFA
jgi:hypothetical protein